MGSDMANIKAGKSSNSNLKVPPLKIVLSSHQNNSAILNVTNQDGDETESRRDKMDYLVESDGDTGDKQITSRKNSRSTPDRKDSDNSQTPAKNDPNSSSSSSTSNSDRSTTTSPSSESESLDSNLTIISDNQQSRSKSEQKEETPPSKQDKTPRHGAKGERSNSNSASASQSNKRSLPENTSETIGDPSNQVSGREQTLNANQRITRSSQRAAQQNKSENLNDMNTEESNVPDYPDKAVESARKVKRRKGEQQESETDGNQPITQQPPVMANICPADYQPPSQNSFELYRDIRKRPYKKMLKLNNFQPKMPQGFNDYLLNSGPYLLDGNRLGLGLSGHSHSTGNKLNSVYTSSSSRLPLRMKLSNLHSKLSSHHASHQRHNSYVIPKLVEVPKSLTVGSPLRELFQDQEKARHQMRMQHLKERERSVMAAEQEILRAYNRVAMADNRQEFNLSACTYFYYQERYHYLDEATGSKKGDKRKEIPHSQDNSNLCIDAPEKSSEDSDKSAANVEPRAKGIDAASTKMETDDETKSGLSEARGQQFNRKDKLANESANHNDDEGPANVAKNGRKESSGTKQEDKDVPMPDAVSKDKPTVGIQTSRVGETDSNHSEEKPDHQIKSVEANGSGAGAVDGDEPATVEISDEDLKILNRSALLDQLQEVDDKWADIKKQMFIRHKNESDSLYAVQSMEWEWKAKEIGACDVRVTLKIENEFVPRVEVSALDY